MMAWQATLEGKNLHMDWRKVMQKRTRYKSHV